MTTEYISGLPVNNLTEETIRQDLPVYITSGRKMLWSPVSILKSRSVYVS